MADHMYRMMVLVSSRHLGINDENSSAGRVFRIASHLPLELQYKLANAIFFCSTTHLCCESSPNHFKIIFNLFACDKI
jgi:hypothetical protein